MPCLVVLCGHTYHLLLTNLEELELASVLILSVHSPSVTHLRSHLGYHPSSRKMGSFCEVG